MGSNEKLVQPLQILKGGHVAFCGNNSYSLHNSVVSWMFWMSLWNSYHLPPCSIFLGQRDDEKWKKKLGKEKNLKSTYTETHPHTLLQILEATVYRLLVRAAFFITVTVVISLVNFTEYIA